MTAAPIIRWLTGRSLGQWLTFGAVVTLAVTVAIIAAQRAEIVAHETTIDEQQAALSIAHERQRNAAALVNACQSDLDSVVADQSGLLSDAYQRGVAAARGVCDMRKADTPEKRDAAWRALLGEPET